MLKNYTPHPISFYHEKDCHIGTFGKLHLNEGAVPFLILPSEGCVRVTTSYEPAGTLGNIPLKHLTTGQPENLPPQPLKGTYIVSLMALRSIQKYRSDIAEHFVSILGMIWDNQGNPIGCTSLSV